MSPLCVRRGGTPPNGVRRFQKFRWISQNLPAVASEAQKMGMFFRGLPRRSRAQLEKMAGFFRGLPNEVSATRKMEHFPCPIRGDRTINDYIKCFEDGNATPEVSLIHTV